MIASLQMYDWPEMHDAYGEYWTLIRENLRQRGIPAPGQMTRFTDESDPWLMHDLVLGQTCGMPYRLTLHDKVTLVGTPDYAVADCPKGYYRSVFVVRANDSRTELLDYAQSVFAFNNRHSQSGYAAAYFHASKFGFWFSNEQESGGHRKSAQMVERKQADIAAIDAVSWRHMQNYEPVAGDLRVIACTDPAPGLPYITANGFEQAAVFEAVDTAIGALSVAAKTTLGIRGLEYISPDVYLALPSI